ncbi:MAG: histidine kinase N-terminal 7TM domain-containing protein [Eubacteriales bacterium]|nr:histidine kinase N-terminal 7TM domain-containing protein [Eubacteriales bacterium]
MSLVLGVLYVLVIGAVTVSMTVLLLMGKKEPYNKMYLGCQGMVICWCVSQILILLSHTETELAFSYLLGNIGICFVGACWFGFASAYGGKQLPKVLRFMPFFLSGMHYAFVLTNQWHHLYYTKFSKTEITHGILFYSNVAETYLFVTIGAVILYRSISKQMRMTKFWRQDGMHAKLLIIAAVLVPVTFNAFYMMGLVRVSFDITPLGFGISGILVLLATIKYRFMEVNIAAFNTVLLGLSDGVVIFDRHDKCTFYNDAYMVLTDNTKKKIPNGVMQVVEEMREMDHLEENVYIDQKQRHLQIQMYQERGASQNTTAKMCEVDISQVVEGVPTVFVIKDISRYYELLVQTKELAVTSEKLALEKERNRIAQQVHDTAGHTLTMIQSYMKLAIVSNEKEEPEKVGAYLEGAASLTSKGIKEIRESINHLRREAESELVTQGILQLADQVKEIPVEVTVQGEDSERYSHLSRVLYDCVRESITNTLKYANASKMDIVLRFKEDVIELMIADDGKGCSDIQDNNGLFGIRERVEQVQGTVKFMSGDGEGFLTRISIPVQ